MIERHGQSIYKKKKGRDKKTLKKEQIMVNKRTRTKENETTSKYFTKTQFVFFEKALFDSLERAKKSWIIGIDVGFGHCDVVSPAGSFIFPYAVKKLPNSFHSLRTLKDTDMIYKDEEGVWAVGELAYTVSENESFVIDASRFSSDKRYVSKEYEICMRVSLALGRKSSANIGSVDGRNVVVQTGYPANRKIDEEKLKEVFGKKHEFSLKIGNGKPEKYRFELGKENVYAMPQPLAGFISAMTDRNGDYARDIGGIPTNDIYEDTYLVMDPGFNTLDLDIISKGTVSEKGRFTDDSLGMQTVFAETAKYINEKYGKNYNALSLQPRLYEGTIHVTKEDGFGRKAVSFAEVLQQNSDRVCERAMETIKNNVDLSYIAGIVGTGGGFDAWQEKIKKMFEGSDDFVIIPANIQDTRFCNSCSNARGYFSYLFNMIYSLEKGRK